MVREWQLTILFHPRVSGNLDTCFRKVIVMPIGLGDKEHNYCKLSFLATAGI
ncbi:hypothetical protein [Candidatus Tisiphia endosymbiont of Hybos culiciformis]|uniref:hypothetical protein n=1 Tax=Candidatus Tisiphia endosymbiont of Hybos culiciformis TaxID=3139331 RepID=UPI003CCB090A